MDAGEMARRLSSRRAALVLEVGRVGAVALVAEHHAYRVVSGSPWSEAVAAPSARELRGLERLIETTPLTSGIAIRLTGRGRQVAEVLRTTL